MAMSWPLRNALAPKAAMQPTAEDGTAEALHASPIGNQSTSGAEKRVILGMTYLIAAAIRARKVYFKCR